jgi:ribonuclease HI
LELLWRDSYSWYFFAEIMAVLYGLQLCWDSGYRKVICFSDSLQLVNLIRDGVSTHHRFANEIQCIRNLLPYEWEVVISHTLREENACADVLAKMGELSTSQLVKINTPHHELQAPLSADAHGVVFSRE